MLFTKLGNLPVHQDYEIGRGTSDSPRLTLYQGDPCLGVLQPTTGIAFTFIVSITIYNEAGNNPAPASDPNVLLVLTSDAGQITVVSEPNGVVAVNIPAIATNNPADATVAAKWETDKPYPFVALGSNGSGEVRVLARGRFYVRDLA